MKRMVRYRQCAYMTKLSREQVKKLFKKSKKLRVPKDFESVEFEGLTYYSWLDQSDMCLGVKHRSRGTWMYSNYKVCNRDMKNNSRINEFFVRMLEKV